MCICAHVYKLKYKILYICMYDVWVVGQKLNRTGLAQIIRICPHQMAMTQEWNANGPTQQISIGVKTCKHMPTNNRGSSILSNYPPDKCICIYNHIYILYVYIIMYIYRHGCLFEHRVPHSIHHLMAISISHPPNIQHTPETIVDVGNQIISLELQSAVS